MSTLRIAAWNANGLAGRLEELECFMNTEKIDICLLSETHFIRESHIKIRNYEVYHSIHPANKARGGSGIILRKSIKHNLEPSTETEKVQMTTLTVYQKKQKLKIAAIYNPPRHVMKKQDYLHIFKALGNRFIIGGDFNAKISTGVLD